MAEPVRDAGAREGARSKAGRWLEGAQKRKEALVVGVGGLVVAYALYRRSKGSTGAQQGTTPGTSTQTTPYPVPTADTTANDLYNALYDNLVAQLGQSSSGTGSPSGAIAGSSSGGSGGAGGGPGPASGSVSPSSAMPAGSSPDPNAPPPALAAQGYVYNQALGYDVPQSLNFEQLQYLLKNPGTSPVAFTGASPPPAAAAPPLSGATAAAYQSNPAVRRYLDALAAAKK